MSRAKQQSSAVVSPVSNGLPPGWTTVRIGEVLNLINGAAFKPSDWSEKGLPIIRIQNLNNSEARYNLTLKKMPEKVRVRSGDLLFAWSGTPGTSFGAHIWRGGEAWLNQHIFRVEFDPALFQPEFLRLAINQNLAEYIAQAHGGAGLAHITKGRFEAFSILLPPFAEQRRIVARLEKLAARSRRARAALDAVPQLLAQARQSLLAAAFRGDLTKDWRKKNSNLKPGTALVKILEAAHEDAGGHKRGNAAQATEGVHNLTSADFPATWGLTDLLNLCSPGKPVTYGILMPGPDQTNGVPYVRVADYPGEVINLKTVRRTTKEIESNFARARLSTGDLLLSIRGSVGRMAIVPPELNGGNITQDTVRLSITAEIETAFVEYMLRAPATSARMQQATKGVAVRGINVGDVRALQIPMPPIPEQHEIVRRLKRAMDHMDAATTAHASAVAELDRLDQSLLARAFTGQLVPKNPHDEPAEKLLERIKISRDKITNTK